MEKPEAMQNVSFLWNDVASLADDNCSFVICKSMVAFAPELPEMKQLEKINIRSITRSIDATREGEQEISGEMAVEIGYETTEQTEAEAAFAVPFKGSYYGTWERSNRPQVVYVDGQAVGFDHLLLETVLAVPSGSTLLRASAQVVGEFASEWRVKLPDTLPSWTQIIGTQAAFETQNWRYDSGLLEVAGQQRLKILYAADVNRGEKVMYYQLPLDFRASLASETLAEGTQLTVGYRSLTAHLLSDREAIVHMNCTVQASGEAGENAEAARESAVVREDAPPAEQAEAAPAVFVGEQPEEPAALQPPRMPPMAAPNGGGCPPRRPSKRDNLLKYMRSLDRGVRSPQCSRNIAFSQDMLEEAENAEQTEK